MEVNKKDLEKSQVELTIELSTEELKPFLESAAAEISKQKEIKGFRPGKAPLDIVIKEAGEMTVYQTAGNMAVQKSIWQALEKEDLEIASQPKIEVQKLAPGNPFIYKATLDLLPKVKICSFDKVEVKPAQEPKIEENEIEKVLNDLKKMRAKETIADKAAEKGDKVEIDFEASVDDAKIEGGSAKKHPLVIGSNTMIPGFEDNLIGLKKDETKEFTLTFPEKYHAENLRGKKGTFKVTVQAVYKREMPEINDEFAKGLGLKDLKGLKSHIESNLKQEKATKEKQRVELDIINQLIEKSEFEEIPESLINQEIEKMMQELQDNITRQGGKMEDYLKSIKKSESDLRLDFTPDAIKRVKTGLLIRKFAQENNIKADKQEIEQEKQKTLASYKMNPAYAQKIDELEKQLNTENANHYFGNLIANRKAIDLIKEKVFNNK